MDQAKQAGGIDARWLSVHKKAINIVERRATGQGATARIHRCKNLK
jgi:hypothetical protein